MAEGPAKGRITATKTGAEAFKNCLCPPDTVTDSVVSWRGSRQRKLTEEMVLRGGDFDALTFDVYGTILDWEPEIADFLHDWTTGVNLEVSKAELLDIYDRVRQPLQSQKPVLRYPEILMQTYDDVITAFCHEPNHHLRETFGRIAEKHRAFPDSIAALDTLRSNGFVLGALSNIDDASFKRVMTAAGILSDVVVTAERVGAYKPDHAHFWVALSDLLARGIPPERVLHVAQSKRADIVPANALGLSCVWVNRPGHVLVACLIVINGQNRAAVLAIEIALLST